ncbi:GFA family protein [Roseovarius salinarum]|jgi:hypothetical protein|uniref:GFA family protein n=1 Tax=Roseovarius salinarum TaxID=1981892 RepID=UPI000C3419DB|nr:GFA family protein [Roseovarius salinarum]
MHKGSCLCGAVAFELDETPRAPIACHCKQCRRQSGHVFAAGHVPKEAVRMIREDGLAWYRASEKATRGFCGTCGSTLFWRADDGPEIGVALGALDDPTGLGLTRHVWVGDKGDYYEIADGLPQDEH